MWLDEIVSCERNVTANGWYKKCDKTCCSNTSEIDIADARNSRMWNERGEKKKKRRMERAFNRSIILLPNYRTSYRRNDRNTTFSNRAIVVGQTGETRPVCKSLDSRRSAKGTAGTKGSRAESEKLASRFQRDTRSKRRRMRDAKGGRRVGEKKRKKEK